MIRGLKGRLDALEQANVSDRSGMSSEEFTVSPIARVVDRMDGDDTVSVTEDVGATSSFIDDFEDADMSEYSDPSNAATIVDYPVGQLQKAVRLDSDSNGGAQDAVSTSGLPYYPTDGDTYRYNAYIPDETRAIHYFASDSSADNGYRVDVATSGDELVVYRVDGGSTTQLFTVDLGTVPTNVYIEVEIAWSAGGGFTVEVFDDSGTSLGSGSTTDSTYLSGGVGWAAATDSTLEQKSAYFDFARTISSSNVIDDFEDQDIAEYSGGTGSASVKSSAAIPVYHGSYGLEISGTATIYTAAGNLNDDAEAGDTFEAHLYLGAGGIGRFLFGVQDGSNYYFVEADAANGDWHLGKVSGGTESTITEDTSVTIPNSEWLTLQVEWTGGGTMTATLFDSGDSQLSQISGTDTSWTSGGHGWAEAASGVTSYGDYALVTPGGAQTSSGDRSVGGIDDFEDNDLDEYDNTSDFAVNSTSPVKEGTYSMKQTLAGSTALTQSQAGLPRYPQAGDTFEAWVYFGSDANQAGVAFAVQDMNNFYLARIVNGTDTLELTKKVAGSFTSLATASVTVGTGWYRLEVAWGEGGSMTLTAYDDSDTGLGSASATDAEWVDGGFGWRGTDDHVAFDDANITTVTSGTGLIDDFEDGDISEYSEKNGTSNSVQTSTVKFGTYALRINNQGSTTDKIQSFAGLDRYPQAGDTFEYYAQATDVSDTFSEIWFGIQEDTAQPPGYTVVMQGNNDTLNLRKYDGTETEVGFGSPLASTSVTWNANEWYRFKVEWGAGGTITVTAFDSGGTQVGQISATDTGYTGGGFGWRVENSSSYFDHAEITAVENTGTVDGFEDNDLDEYSNVTADAATQSTTVYDGSYALRMGGQNTGWHEIITTLAGLTRYPAAGDTIRLRYRPEIINPSGTPDDAQLLFSFATQSAATGSRPDNHYGALVRPAVGDIVLEKVVSGTRTAMASTTYTSPSVQWFIVEIDWGSSGSITMTFKEEDGTQIAQISATDTNFTDGGIGFNIWSNNGVYEYYADIVELV